jgi:hypothetical protein
MLKSWSCKIENKYKNSLETMRVERNPKSLLINMKTDQKKENKANKIKEIVANNANQ